MLPETYDNYDEVTQSSDSIIFPTATYKLDFESGQVGSKIEGMDAILQAVTKILFTDKYAYEIYTGYGNELYTLIGQPYEYVIAEIPRMVIEALEYDDRIIDVQDFRFSKLGSDSVGITFELTTLYGIIDISTEVNYG